MGRTVYLVIIVVFAGVAAYAEASAVPAITAPLFSWANEKYLSAAGQASRTSYQVYGDFSSTLKGFITSAVSHGSEIPSQLDWLDMQAVQQQGPEVVLVVLGNQLKTSHLRSKAAQSMLAPLQRLMDKAESSIAVPYVMHDVSAALGNREKGVQELAAGLDKTIVVGCEGGSEGGSQQSIASALQAVGDEPHVIITCTQVQEGSAGTPPAVAAELQQLQEAHDAVAALNKRQLTVYAVQPDASALVQQRRRLQSSNADVGVCGQLCQTQVKWLEGILAAFILTLAAFSGMCCLYMLDTPTRFEKPKEGTSRAE